MFDTETTKQLIQGLIDLENPHHVKRAKLLLDSIELSDEVRSFMSDILDQKHSKEEPMVLTEILKDTSVKEYIQSLVDERVDAIKTDLKATHDQSVQDLNTEIKDLKSKVQEKEQAVDSATENQRKMLLDSIISMAKALRKPEIDLENVTASADAYRESFKENSIEDLEKKYKDLSDEIDSIFTSHNPHDTAGQEGIRKDGNNPDTDTDNSDNDKKELDTSTTNPWEVIAWTIKQ